MFGVARFERELEQVMKAAGGIVGQRGACAVLENAALVQHQDLVDVAQRAEAVSDDERGAAAHELANSDVESRLGLGVDPSGGFVEHDQIGIAQPDAGEWEGRVELAALDLRDVAATEAFCEAL